MISTVIIDGIKQERDKIAALLPGQMDIKVMAQGCDGYDALKLTGNLKPDIIILNNHLELIEGENLPPLLKIRSPSTSIVLLIAKISDIQLFKTLSTGVSGIVHREKELEMLPGILQCISQGGCFISPWVSARVLRQFSIITKKGAVFHSPQPEKPHTAQFARQHLETKISHCEDPMKLFSKTELKIISYIGEGFTSREIAERLNLAVGTVRNYISLLMRRTGLHNRSQIARYACFYGLATLD